MQFACCAPSVNICEYRHLRKEPCETVRFFQLAVELGMWKEAADCLVYEKEEIGPLEIWALSGLKRKEFGDLSLNDIILGTHFINLVELGPPVKEGGKESQKAVVMVLSHPRPGIDQQYDLGMLKLGNIWYIDLDRTFFELNVPQDL